MTKKNKKNKNKKNNRSERIKQACMEKSSKKNEPDHRFIIFHRKGKNNKGGHCWGRSDNKSLCKITCRNKSHGGKH